MKGITKLLLVMGLMVVVLAGLVLAQSKGSSRTAWMGIYTQTVDADLARTFDLDIEYGAIINSVVDDSPADRAGLRDDDIVIAIDGMKVTDSERLTKLIQKADPGDLVVVTVIRDGRKKKIKVTLDNRLESVAEDDNNAYYKGAYRFDDQAKKSYGGTWTRKAPQVIKSPKRVKLFYADEYGSHGYIGVSLVELGDQLADYFGVSDDIGVLVSEVKEDSPAEKAGIKAGDVIVMAEDEEIEDAGDLQRVIRRHDEGDQVQLSVMRDRKKMSVTVEVAERDNDFTGIWTVPNVPNIDIQVPKLNRVFRDDAFHWNMDMDEDERAEFERDMEKLRQEMKELRANLKKELKQLRDAIDN